MVANFVVMGAALPFFYQPMPIEHVGMIALLAILGWTGGMLSIAAYKTGKAVVVAPMQYSQIIWASIFGYVFFAESIDLNTAIGASIIIASGVYIVLREGYSKASANHPVLETRARPETGVNFRIGPFLRMAEARDKAK